jgi:serine/threonine-protein kinase
MSALQKLGSQATGAHTPLSGRAFVGETLGGKYRVTRVLGLGGMGIVCEARHIELGGRRFAVKLVQRYFAGSELAVARFRREVRAIAAIESDHIVQVTDVGVDETFGLYMVMEFLQGEDLSSHLHRVGQIKPIEAVKIAHQIARGLAKAHEARIIHRDLKPGNVFLTRRDDGSVCVKIYDFGISKLVGDPEKTGTWNAELTAVGMPVGTPQYMSPEQAHGRSDLDPRSDVWSLGAVLFEMLAGRGPYPPRGRVHHTIMRVMSEDPPLLEQVAPWVPVAVAQIVDGALQRDRDRRIPDCNVFAEMLERAMPAAFGMGPARADDEVTVVASRAQPPSDPPPAMTDGDRAGPPRPPTHAPETLTTPRPRQENPEAFEDPHDHHATVVDPVIDLADTSHMRLAAPKNAPNAASPKRRGRGVAALAVLGLATLVAVLVASQAGHIARSSFRSSVAPVPALSR